MLALAQVLPKEARKPSLVQGRLSDEVSIMGPHRGNESTIARKAALTRTETRRPAQFGPVVVRPGQTQNIALSLAGPKCKHDDGGHLRRRHSRKASQLIIAPDHIRAISAIEPPAALAWVDCDDPPVLSEGEEARKHRPRVVRLARRIRHFVAPFEEVAANS